MEAVDPFDMPPQNFAAAIARDDKGEFMSLLQREGNPDAVTEFRGMTLLHFAVMQDRAWAVEPLLEKGADPNRLTLSGRTALDIALDRSSPVTAAVVEALKLRGAKKAEELEAGDIHADLERKYFAAASVLPLDESLLRVLVRNHPGGLEGFAEDFAARHGNFDPLQHAVMEGSAPVTRFWLEQGLSPERKTAEGCDVIDLEAGKAVPNPQILMLLANYRMLQKKGIIDETVIRIPSPATVAGLRRPQSDLQSDTLLYRLSRHGSVQDLIKIASGDKADRLTVEELTCPTHAWKSPLQFLAERELAREFLSAPIWAGRRNDLSALIAHAGSPFSAEEQDKILREADIGGLREKARKAHLKLKP